MSACVSRKEIEATLWLNNSPIPAEFCDREPELRLYGFYRRLNSGKLEFVSYCDKEAKRWFAIHEIDMNRLLDRSLPESRSKNSKIKRYKATLNEIQKTTFKNDQD